MNYKFWFTGRSYFQKIIFFMSLFSLIIFMPFAIITYKLSENSTLKSINASNNAVLSQINYTYKYLTGNVSNICMELFLKNDVRNLMYSKDMPYNEIAACILEIEDTTLVVNPSIYSVSIFNKNTNNLYTTKFSRQAPEEELFDFIAKQGKIDKLKPILRKMTIRIGDLETSSYVFSYFMYEFGDPKDNTSSFLVINQNANWFMDNIVNNTYSSNSFATSTYLLNKSGEVLKGINSSVEPEAEKYIIGNYEARMLADHADNGTSPQHNIEKFNGRKYILSSIRLGDSENSLLIIQDYNQVFKNHIELRNNFIVVGICFLFTMIVALIIFSFNIYKPVNNLMSNFIQKKDIIKGNKDFKRLNEFEYLNEIYKNVKDSNSSLKSIAEHYQLSMLINDSSISAFHQFKAIMPDHWLSTIDECSLCIIMFKIDKFEHNNFGFEPTDMELLIFSVHNIAEEIICQQLMNSSFISTKNSFGMIINLADKMMDQEQKLYQKLQKFQSLVKQYLDITVTISYSSGGNNVTAISSLYKEAKDYMSYSYIFGKHKNIINRDMCRINIENVQTTYPQELDDKLVKAMGDGDLEQIKIALADIKNVVCTLKSNNITICLMALVNLVNKAMDDLNSRKDIVKNYGDIYQRAIDAEHIDDFFDELINHVNRHLLNEGTAFTEGKEQLFVSTIIKYVQKNYDDIGLSSVSIADYLGMSSKYVMRKFKEHTNVSLNDYIMNYRMKKAVSMLQNTDLSISKIAEKIGIENETYFYKLFKKMYDCTPREYTEMNFKSKT